MDTGLTKHPGDQRLRHNSVDVIQLLVPVRGCSDAQAERPSTNPRSAFFRQRSRRPPASRGAEVEDSLSIGIVSCQPRKAAIMAAILSRPTLIFVRSPGAHQEGGRYALHCSPGSLSSAGRVDASASTVQSPTVLAA
jgi:hypothetical protein